MTDTQLKIIKRALFDSEMIEIKKLEKFPQVKAEHSPEYVRMISELREKAKRRESSVISFSPRRKIILLIAVLVILAIAVTACAFGKEIKDFFFEVYETFTKAEVKGEPNDDEFKQYMPSCIPDGYALIDNEVTDSSSRIIWSNGTHHIYLDQDKQSSNKIILDTEESVYSIKIIGNREIHYIEKNNTCTLLWIDNGYQFLLICHNSVTWESIENLISGISDLQCE